MFGKFKKADTAEAQNHALTDAARDAAHAAATSLRKPQIVTEIQRPAAQVAADDKDVKRRQRLDEIKTEMHSRLLDNLNLAALETAKEADLRSEINAIVSEQLGELGAVLNREDRQTTFGTSISEALRVYADEMRDKRVMRAEEKASTLPTKLTLGTMIFCLPPLLVILIGPSIYGVVMDLQRGM
jgi:hypothetical protein